MSLINRSRPVELFALLLICVLVHGLVLLFIYPRFYDPLWPFHSDFYAPAHLVNSEQPFLSLLLMPRPIGMVYFYLTGMMGIRGAILANLLIVFMNVSLTAMVLRRLTNLPLSSSYLVFFVFFAFLIFTHPYQYVWSIYDVFSQLSYLLLSLAVVSRLSGFGLSIQVTLVVLAFLTKETHALTFLGLIAAWWYFSEASAKRSIFKLGCSTIVIITLVLLLNRYFKSPFLGSGSGPDSPYVNNFSLFSLSYEWLRYANDGMSFAGWILIIFSGSVLFFSHKKNAPNFIQFSLVLSVLGTLAWLPNSALPNHHYQGYSFNGSYLMFSPILLLFTVAGLTKKWRFLASLLCAFSLLTPIFGMKRFNSNEWTISQQHAQKRLLNSIESLAKRVPSNAHRILISGLESPFSPFEFQNSLLQLGFHRSNVIDVVTYQKGKTGAATLCSSQTMERSLVRFVEPQVPLCERYDQIWVLSADGSIRETIVADSLTKKIGLVPSQLMIFPRVAAASGISLIETKKNFPIHDGYRMFESGKAYLDYGEFAEALKCFSLSAELIPENPYVFYFSGLAAERMGDINAANKFFERAVELDKSSNTNKAFSDSLRRAQSQLEKTGRK
jgi:tetratricopeptide (TPR) repeat protein